MQRDDVLDFVRKDVEAGDQDHVLLPVDDAEKSLLVHGGDIAGAQETIRVHDLLGRLGTLPVALHHLRAAHAELARLADGQLPAIVVADHDLGGRQRQADRAGEHRFHRGRLHADDGRGLGQAVALLHVFAGDLVPALRHRGLQRHAAGARPLQVGEIQFLEALILQQRVVERVDARDDGEGPLRQFFHEGLDVARVRDQHVEPAHRHEQQAVTHQAEHVIERQRRDHDFPALLDQRADPGMHLPQVGNHVPVRQHRALGHTGGAAGVLQERDVLLADLDGAEALRAAARQRRFQAQVPGQAVGRHQLLHPPDHEVDDVALRERQQVADPGHGDMFHRRLGNDLLERGGEALEDDDGLRPGIDQLVLQLARRVQGIHVDHRHARTQHAEQRHRVLQEIRQHDRHPGPAREAEILAEPRGELRRHPVKLAIAETVVHARERRAIREARRTRLENAHQRGAIVEVDFRRGSRQVALNPGLVQVQVLHQ